MSDGQFGVPRTGEADGLVGGKAGKSLGACQTGLVLSELRGAPAPCPKL